ncbi:DUF6626 family protein [Terasakiella sp. SH-1]|uniref:DUF6626 family protein n=1 Tax=Terasakiella sp. SH-1 TaxID=2560057 RepID=UPI001073F649|nr:DUF6626 family protein [Terasakiella sp. SH-1]
MNYLNYTYKKLKDAGLTTGFNDFSRRFLMKNESYARTIRARQKDLPLPSLIILTARVSQSSQNLLATNVGRELGEELGALAQELSEHVYKRALSGG